MQRTGLGAGTRLGIIHGLLVVEEDAISSTPEACALPFHYPRRAARALNANLSAGVGACEFVTEVVEVIRADPELQHFLDHRQE